MAVTKQKSVFSFSVGEDGSIVIGATKTSPNDIYKATVVGTENGGDDIAVVDIEEMSVKQLREYLTQIGVDFPSDATKAELRELAKA